MSSRLARRGGRPAEYMYTADGQIWRRGIAQLTRDPVHLFAGVAVDGSPRTPVAQVLDRPGPHAAAGLSGVTVSPDGRRSAFTALGDLWLAEQRNARRLTDDPYVDVDPDFTPDGEAVVFASDRGGTMALWHLNLATGALSQLTRETGKAYLPKVDPTGRYAAYLHTDGFGPWSASALRIVTLDASSNTRTIAEGLRDVGELGWDHRDGGWRITVGTLPRGPAEERQVSSFDAGVRGGAAAQNPAPETAVSPELEGGSLEWSPSAPAAPYVVQVGRLFDGIRNDYRHHVDVHVEGQRISAIVGRGRRALPATVIDARDATVIPGLIDVHVHQSSLSGERLGRIWLAHGVTTVRELTGDVAAALEARRIVGQRAAARAPIDRDTGARRYQSRRDSRTGIPDRGQVLRALGRRRRAQPAQTTAPVPDCRTARAHTARIDLARSLLAGGARDHDIAAESELPGFAWHRDRIGHVREHIPGGARRRRAGSQAASAAARSGSCTAVRNCAAGRLRPREVAQRCFVRSRTPWPGSFAAAATRQQAPTLLPCPTAMDCIWSLRCSPTRASLLPRSSGSPRPRARWRSASTGQLGTLEQGKLADFVVVDGDPLVSISDARSVTAVVKGGVWHTQSELLERP